MSRAVRESIDLGGICLAVTLSGAALASEPISNTLTAERVVRVDGAEHLESAAAGKPGDVIQYTVRFHNAGSTPAHALEATLPIPVGVALIPGSVQRPAPARASMAPRSRPCR